jgi:hypothetical protein
MRGYEHLGWPSLRGLSPAPEVPDDHHDPSGALIPVAPVFTNTEQLALAGFLAGYSGLTRQAYELDLRSAAWALNAPGPETGSSRHEDPPGREPLLVSHFHGGRQRVALPSWLPAHPRCGSWRRWPGWSCSLSRSPSSTWPSAGSPTRSPPPRSPGPQRCWPPPRPPAAYPAASAERPSGWSPWPVSTWSWRHPARWPGPGGCQARRQRRRRAGLDQLASAAVGHLRHIRPGRDVRRRTAGPAPLAVRATCRSARFILLGHARGHRLVTAAYARSHRSPEDIPRLPQARPGAQR